MPTWNYPQAALDNGNMVVALAELDAMLRIAQGTALLTATTEPPPANRQDGTVEADRPNGSSPRAEHGKAAQHDDRGPLAGGKRSKPKASKSDQESSRGNKTSKTSSPRKAKKKAKTSGGGGDAQVVATPPKRAKEGTRADDAKGKGGAEKGQRGANLMWEARGSSRQSHLLAVGLFAALVVAVVVRLRWRNPAVAAADSVVAIIADEGYSLGFGPLLPQSDDTTLAAADPIDEYAPLLEMGLGAFSGGYGSEFDDLRG
jgi:hypothetical protein